MRHYPSRTPAYPRKQSLMNTYIYSCICARVCHLQHLGTQAFSISGLHKCNLVRAWFALFLCGKCRLINFSLRKSSAKNMRIMSLMIILQGQPRWLRYLYIPNQIRGEIKRRLSIAIFIFDRNLKDGTMNLLEINLPLFSLGETFAKLCHYLHIREISVAIS